VKWNLGADYSLGILAAGSPTATQISCTTGDPVNTATLTDTAGGSGLQDNGGGAYIYVWKTLKSWSGTCQLFTLTLNDGHHPHRHLPVQVTTISRPGTLA